MGDRPAHLLPRYANCWTLRPNVPETPPCPPTARQSGRLDLGETVHRRGCSRGLPVRQRLGGRAAFRNLSLMLGLVSKYPGCRVAGQSKLARSGTVTPGSIAGSKPSNCVLVAASSSAFVPGVPQFGLAARRHGPESSHGSGGLRAGARRADSHGMSRCSRRHRSKAAWRIS